MRSALRFGYDGRLFEGYARNPGNRTVEQELLDALNEQQSGAVLYSGSRTDRGASAAGNVCAVDTDGPIEPRRLNAGLVGIWVTGLAPVVLESNPRKADWRWYRYIITDPEIDPERAKACASLFQGTHDFRSFAKVDDRDTKRRIIDIGIEDYSAPESPFRVTVMDVVGESFLWQMIRRIASAVIGVGTGVYDMADARNALEGSEDGAVFGPAPPEPLVLMEVAYENVYFEDVQRETGSVRLARERISRDIMTPFLYGEMF